MLARTRAFALGLAATLIVGFAWSQQSVIGGFPSRVSFATVNGVAPSDWARLSQPSAFSGSSASGRVHSATNTNAGTGAWVEWAVANNAGQGVHFGITSSAFSGAIIPGVIAGPASFLYGDGANDFYLGSGNAARVRMAGDGSLINLMATSVQANGVALQNGATTRQLVASVFDNGSTCDITSNLGVASCVRNSPGNLTVTYSASFSTTWPVCVASATAAGRAIAITAVSTSSVTVARFVTTTGAAEGGQVNLHCSGL